MSKFIQFDYPEGTVYAGKYKGGAGWAPTLATAWFFDSADDAEMFAQNAYGAASQEYAKVIEVDLDSAERRVLGSES